MTGAPAGRAVGRHTGGLGGGEGRFLILKLQVEASLLLAHPGLGLLSVDYLE